LDHYTTRPKHHTNEVNLKQSNNNKKKKTKAQVKKKKERTVVDAVATRWQKDD
jgi:hypothetical protein